MGVPPDFLNLLRINSATHFRMLLDWPCHAVLFIWPVLLGSAMHWHRLFLWIRIILGFLFIYAALFLYEDEEGVWQNRLEKWRYAVGRKKESSMAGVAQFVRSIAALTGRIFDRLFGYQLISLRGIGVSACYSIASFLLSLQLVSILKLPKAPPMSLETWFQFGLFCILGSIPAFIQKKELWLWGMAVFASTVIPFGRVFDLFALKVGYSLTFGVSTFVVFIFSVSLAFDVLYIALTRWMLRKAAESARLFKIIGVIALNCALGVFLGIGPIILGLIALTIDVKLSGPTWFGVASIGVMLGSLLNLVDILACSAFLLVLIFILLHRLVWPLIERPLYACARFQVIKNKKLLWTAGLVLIFAPKGVALGKWVLARLLG